MRCALWRSGGALTSVSCWQTGASLCRVGFTTSSSFELGTGLERSQGSIRLKRFIGICREGEAARSPNREGKKESK